MTTHRRFALFLGLGSALIWTGCDGCTVIDPPETLTDSTTLALAKNGPLSTPAGFAAEYVIVTTNSGAVAAIDVVVEDILPTGALFRRASRGGALAGNVVTWPPSTIAPGDSLADTVWVRYSEGGSSPANTAQAAASNAALVSAVDTVAITAIDMTRIRDLIRSLPCDAFDVGVSPATLDTIAQALTGGPTFENEIHDCQRLVAGDTFGPMIGVFPLDDGMGDDFVEGPVASLFNYSFATEGAGAIYPSLGLTAEWSCLWMKTGDGGRTWVATIYPVTNLVCGGLPNNPDPMGQFLVRTSNPADVADLPATARWRWDETTDAHYMGLKCGARWCSFGQAGFVSAEPGDFTGNPYETIPGYFDEQHLGIPDGNGLRPGPWGRIAPSATLSAAKQSSDISGALVRVANIQVRANSTAERDVYARKLNLREESPNFLIGDVWLSITSPTAEYRGNQARAANMSLVPMVKHGVTGSVRWRWRETDETPWISCITGCCSVDEAN